MTKKNLVNSSLITAYTFIMLIFGCIPEDSLQWSSDGSKGIYSKKGALFLVDGGTGALTQIASKETTTLWPAISPDGSMFAYGQIVKVDNFNNALNLLPPAQVKEIETHAKILKQKTLKNLLLIAYTIKKDNYDLVFLDEIITCIAENFIAEDRVIEFIRNQAGKVEYDEIVEDYVLRGRSLLEIPEASRAYDSVKMIMKAVGYC